MLSNSKLKTLEKTGLQVDYITKRLCKSGAGNIVMFIDACRSDYGAKGTHLENTSYQGIITFYSCKHDQYSYENKNLHQGIFTHVLLKVLEGVTNGCITAKQLETSLQEEVPRLIKEDLHLSCEQEPLARAEPIFISDLPLFCTSQEEQVNTLKKQLHNSENEKLKKLIGDQLIKLDPDDPDVKKNQEARVQKEKSNGLVKVSCLFLSFWIPLFFIIKPPDLSENFSSGERSLFIEINNINETTQAFIEGTDLFKKAKNIASKNKDEAAKIYNKSYQKFQKSESKYPNEPEPKIYRNNAEAREKSDPFVLAVSVPGEQQLDAENKEILWGIADAQEQFNHEKKGINGRLLEIIIVNDEMNTKLIPYITNEVVKRQEILGIIGHHVSETSREAIKIGAYRKANLAMVSAISTSSDLNSEEFFRVVVSTEPMAERLAEYAKHNKIQKVAVFYTSGKQNKQSVYSQSMYNDFGTHLRKNKITIVESIDINNLKSTATDNQENSCSDKTSIKDIENITRCLEKKVDAIALFPQAERTSYNNAIEIAKVISDHNKNYKIKTQLLGGNSLYRREIIDEISNNKIFDLGLVVPWFSKEKSSCTFATNTRKTWDLKKIEYVTWRTAMSYDATKAFIKALELSIQQTGNATRASILNNLRKVHLPASETSGQPLEFKKNERQINPVIVQLKGGKFELWPSDNKDSIICK